jgi:hypothetical protein
MRSLTIFLFITIMLASTAMATPTIDQLVANPQEAWLGDMVNITARCVDNETISRVYADVQGPGIILPSLDFSFVGDGMYTLNIPGQYFDRRGSYTSTVYCASNGTQNASIGFSISELKGQISGVTNPVYSGNTVEIQYIPKKNDDAITTGITFSVFIDGQQGQFKIPPVYDTTKGWLLRLEAPPVGVHNIVVEGNYQGKIIQSDTSIEVKPIVEFEIASIDRTNIRPGDSINFAIRALNKGSIINLNESNLVVHVDNIEIDMDSIAQSNNLFNVKITAPTLSTGRYHLTIDMSYNGSTYTAQRDLDYVAVIEGKFTDVNGKAVSMQMRFLKSNVEKFRISTLTDGTYSGQIIPDTYDVDIDFPDANIHLDRAVVTTANNPVNYIYNTYIKVEGIVASGIYQISIVWKFDSARLRLRYDDIFENKSGIKIFYCSSWSQKCNSAWAKAIPDIESNANRAIFTTSVLGAFVVGTEDTLQMILNLDKAKYGEKDFIKVKGSTFGQQTPIGNVTITLKIDNTYIDQTITSDSKGLFSLEFVGPENDGNYTIKAEARKPPLTPYSSTYRLEVISVPSVSIVFPGSLRVEKGKNVTEEIRIINTGQQDITNVHLGIALDNKYFSIPAYPERIGIKEEIRIPLTLFSYDDDLETTQSAAINFSSDQITQNKIFGFTILAPSVKNNTQEPPLATGLATSQISLPGVEITYLAIFAAVLIAGVYLLKKFKGRNRQQLGISMQANNNQYHQYQGRSFTRYDNHKNSGNDAALYLAEIKNYLARREESV